MIITKLIGGLGNQMFQYAAGRRAAYVNNTNLKLDITGYENQKGITPREYMLNIFNIKENFATFDDVQRLKGSGRNFFAKYLPKLTKRIVPYYKQPYVKQKCFHFNPNILKVGKNTYLDGTWQSEKYFEDIEKIIRNDFTYKFEPSPKNKKLIYQIVNSSSISIHVRRGDYNSDYKTRKFHGLCNLNYYYRAVSIMTRKIKASHFFVFSDDPNWVRKNFHLKYPFSIIDHNFQKNDYEDLRLMGLCKHNIVANSSFSWWGAWLNQNSSKIIIAPKKWFKDSSVSIKDLIPRSWIKI